MLKPLRITGIVLITLLTSSLVSAEAKGQHVSGARSKTDSVPPRKAPAPLADSAIENRLVALALEGPKYKASDHMTKAAEYKLSEAKRVWLNLLSISANYNDQTFAKTTPATGGYVYPKYFFGLTIPIGLFFSMGPQIKGARENVAVNASTREELARQIKADVLSKYRQYKNFGELILLQNTIVVDYQAAFTQVEKKFKDGAISIELYNQANKNYSDELVKKLNLQLSQDLVKLSIEEMIGVSLESVIK